MNFDLCWDNVLKSFLYSVWITLLAIISPIYYVFIALFISWLGNFLMGMKTDKKVNNSEFSITKAFDSIKQIGFFGMAALFIYLIPRLMGDEWLGKKGINAITYVVSYYYLTNTFRNAKLYWPKSQPISLIYEVLTTQIFSSLKQYIGLKNEKN